MSEPEDIVDELREYARDEPQDNIYSRAADEINRLRTALQITRILNHSTTREAVNTMNPDRPRNLDENVPYGQEWRIQPNERDPSALLHELLQRITRIEQRLCDAKIEPLSTLDQ